MNAMLRCFQYPSAAPLSPATVKPGQGGRARAAGAALALACAILLAPPAAGQARGGWVDPYGGSFLPGPQGISRLSAAQSYPVRPAEGRVRVRELPPPVLVEPESGTDGWIPLPVEQGELFGPDYDWRYVHTWGPDDAPVEVVSSAERTARRFSPVAGLSGLQYGQQGLTYRQAGGPSLSVGMLRPNAPRWSNVAPISGLQLARWSGAADAVLPEGTLGYSSTIGRLDYSDPAAESGGLLVGPSAGGGSLRYGLTSDLTLESHLQRAPDLTAVGLGGVYSLGGLGTLQAGAVQAHMQQYTGWRYQVGYNVDLFESVRLGYQGVTTDRGYGDLASYASGPLTAASQRNVLTAGLPLGSYGTFSGTFNTLRADGITTEQRLGVQHSMELTPRTRFMLGANRDAVSGAYQMLMQLTLPVDVLEGSLVR
ncbi:hypothetical protein V8Z80_14955 [Orrella sp. JC864]|uniref:hypothetical protein n=1 Tax=Orrella sp. JC864 TaxID=3120298 RepID=UPI0030090517